jgi:hypothetical protein
MKCKKAKKMISEFIDENQDPKENLALKSHLENCSDCQGILEDFKKIRSEAENLEKFSPSGQTWPRILAGVKEEKSAPTREKLVRPSFLTTLPKLQPVYAAAMLLVIVVGAVSIGIWYGTRSSTFPTLDRQLDTYAKLEEAEHHYTKAIEALRDVMINREKDLDPQIVAVFQRNLEIIDASIAECKQLVLSDPEDIDSRRYLLAVYKNKADLLFEVLALEQSPSQVMGMEQRTF